MTGLKAYRTNADDNCVGADGHVNRLVPRFAGFGKGFGSRWVWAQDAS